MELKEAREKYKNGELTFKQLDIIFFKKASEEEKQTFWAAPVYDRPFIVEGLSKNQIDEKFNKILKQIIVDPPATL